MSIHIGMPQYPRHGNPRHVSVLNIYLHSFMYCCIVLILLLNETATPCLSYKLYINLGILIKSTHIWLWNYLVQHTNLLTTTLLQFFFFLLSINMSPDSTVAKTDLTRWRMKSDRGRQTWHYLKTDEELQEWPQSISDKYFLGLDMVSFFWFVLLRAHSD